MQVWGSGGFGGLGSRRRSPNTNLDVQEMLCTDYPFQSDFDDSIWKPLAKLCRARQDCIHFIRDDSNKGESNLAEICEY